MILSCSGVVDQYLDPAGYVPTCSTPWLLLNDPTPVLAALSYAEAGQIIGATALLFSTAFIVRLVLKHFGVI